MKDNESGLNKSVKNIVLSLPCTKFLISFINWLWIQWWTVFFELLHYFLIRKIRVSSSNLQYETSWGILAVLFTHLHSSWQFFFNLSYQCGLYHMSTSLPVYSTLPFYLTTNCMSSYFPLSSLSSINTGI